MMKVRASHELTAKQAFERAMQIKSTLIKELDLSYEERIQYSSHDLKSTLQVVKELLPVVFEDRKIEELVSLRHVL